VSQLPRIPIFILAALLLSAGCAYNKRYIAGRSDLDPKTREAILQHRVILGMYPDEALAAIAPGQFASAVKADTNRWPEGTESSRVIYSQRAHPDDSYIDLVFWTRTQFDTPEPVGFKVVFSRGRAISITRTPIKNANARLSEKEAIRIAEEAAVKHGYRLADYIKLREPNYEGLGKKNTWSVFFECKAPTPARQFTVWIDDRTQEAHIEPWE
jgi:hypothetical protein